MKCWAANEEQCRDVRVINWMHVEPMASSSGGHSEEGTTLVDVLRLLIPLAVKAFCVWTMDLLLVGVIFTGFVFCCVASGLLCIVSASWTSSFLRPRGSPPMVLLSAIYAMKTPYSTSTPTYSSRMLRSARSTRMNN
jgi:hypothetical protein